MSDQPQSLSGCTALVTGAAKRIGRAVALALAKRGANIVVHYHRSRQEAQVVADEIQALGVQAVQVQADLQDLDQSASLVTRAAQHIGPTDVLVNSASIFENSRVTDFEFGELERNVRINAMAPLLLARTLARQGRPGRIVNLLDARVVDYDRENVAYHLSKRMLFSLTRMLAVELAPRVRVNAVAPGLILPPSGRDESYLEELAHTNPLQTYGSPQDVARAVLFLLENDFITGQVLYVDGGRHMVGNMYGG